MSSEKTGDTEQRYSDICGATNRNSDPCKLPAGWGTAGSGGNRCKFHGGASTGPSDTSHLESNDFAEDNPGGGAPTGNTNAEIHGGFSDWKKAYERFDRETKAYVDRLIDCMRERAKEHAPEVAEERRERLLKEKATLSILEGRASFDVFAHKAEDARGFIIKEEIEIDSETYTVEKVNPAMNATTAISARRREIAKQLRLWPGFQNQGDP